MTVKELREKIKDLPDDMEVMIRQENEEYDFSMAEFAGVKDIRFYDEEYDEEDAPDIPCFCITDE